MADVSYEFLQIGDIGQIPLDFVPDDRTDDFRFWRAVSLAKIALNIEDDRPALNAGPNGDSTIFFFDQLSSVFGARSEALYWAERHTHVQLSRTDIDRLLEKARRPLKEQTLPRIVLALDVCFNDIELPPEAYYHKPGVNIGRPIGIEDVDPYSRGVIGNILGL